MTYCVCLAWANFSIFETQSHFVAQAKLEFVILPSSSWNYR